MASAIRLGVSFIESWRNRAEQAMLAKLGNSLRFFIRTPAHAALSLVVLALLGWALAQGWNELHVSRSQAAAEEALQAYDFAAAQQHLAVCLSHRPEDPQLLLLAVQAYRRDGKLDRAAEHLDRYIGAAGTSTPEGKLESALIKVQLGRVKEHVYGLLEEIEIRHPASEQIMESLAVGCVHTYRLDEARFWSHQLLQRYPTNPVARLLEAQTLNTLRKREEALLVAQELHDDYPRYIPARLYLADLLFRSNQFDEATLHYRELHRRRPEELVPLLGLTASLLKQERLEETGPLVAELEAKHGESSAALLECARVALAQNEVSEAERLLRRAVELAPFDHEIHLELAMCLERLGRTDESRRHAERFQEIEADMKQLDAALKAAVNAPNDPAPRLEAGRICLRNGQATEGLRWLSGVLDLAPNHPGAHQMLARYYESVGDAALARYHRARLGRPGAAAMQ
jgi:Flp pilus assembly protein TadD